MIYIEWELFETNPNKDTIVDEIHYFWLTNSDLRGNSCTFKLEPFVEHDIARSILLTNAWNERSGKLVSRWDSYEVQYNLYYISHMLSTDLLATRTHKNMLELQPTVSHGIQYCLYWENCIILFWKLKLTG